MSEKLRLAQHLSAMKDTVEQIRDEIRKNAEDPSDADFDYLSQLSLRLCAEIKMIKNCEVTDE